MSGAEKGHDTPGESENSKDSLRQALYRLTEPHFLSLQREIDAARDELKRQQQEIDAGQNELDQLRQATAPVPGEIGALEHRLMELQMKLADDQETAQRLRRVLGKTLADEIQEDTDTYAGALAPVISPAIRNQIRDSRDDIIAALSPIIGPTISAAIAEAFNDLRRTIDVRLKQSMNARTVWQRFRARLSGVSEADLMLREALPYTVNNIFLINRLDGLLLAHISASQTEEDAAMISAMLTAIRRFARDALGTEDDSLDEIQYGGFRILLETGHLAYLAVVIQGDEPAGYGAFMRTVVEEINLEHETQLHQFARDGDMGALPDFEPALSPLLTWVPDMDDEEEDSGQLTGGQKTALTAGILGLLGVIVLAIFLCNFTTRLWPVAYPPPTATASITPAATLTPSITPSLTPTATQTSTQTPSLTPSATPSQTPSSTPAPSQTPQRVKAVMVGNVWVRSGPGQVFDAYDIPININTPVDVTAVYGGWAQIEWTNEYGLQQGWAPLNWIGLVEEIPASLVTPVE